MSLQLAMFTKENLEMYLVDFIVFMSHRNKIINFSESLNV